MKKRTHSFIDHYDPRAPSRRDPAVLVIDDPYGVPVDAEAKLIIPKSARGRPSNHVRVWSAPQVPQIEVIATLRNDTLGMMFARGQIGRESFLAGREYQALVEFVEPRAPKSSAMAALAKGSSDPTLGIAARVDAAKRLRQYEKSFVRERGVEGLRLMRDILIESYSISRASASRGDRSQRSRDYWAQSFRRGLLFLATVLGLATKAAYRNKKTL